MRLLKGVIADNKPIVKAEVNEAGAPVGMALMQMIGARLTLNFEKAEVVLTG